MHSCILKSLFYSIFKVAVIVSLLHGNANFPILLNCASTPTFSSLLENRQAYPHHLTHPFTNTSLTVVIKHRSCSDHPHPPTPPTPAQAALPWPLLCSSGTELCVPFSPNSLEQGPFVFGWHMFLHLLWRDGQVTNAAGQRTVINTDVGLVFFLV